MNRFHLSLEIREALQVLEYKTPTPIQEKVIPLALKGENIRVQSKTGSGKTAAFGIPLCENIEWEIGRASCRERVSPPV